MKLLLMGDPHVDTRNPENRIDNYFETQWKKFDWAYELAHLENCGIVLIPGDFFNSHRANDFLMQHYINLLRYWSDTLTTLTIFGQHDMRYHSSDRLNTPLWVLHSARALTVLQEDPISIKDPNGQEVIFRGCSWGEDIPDIELPREAYNVLLIHRMIIRDEKLWEGQEDFTYGNHLLRTTKFDLIVSGDNHETFSISNENRMLINPGSIMRSRIDQKFHRPCVYIVDTEKGVMDQRYFPIKPIGEVMDLEKAEEKKERNEKLDVFIKSLSTGVKIEGLNFTKNLMRKIQSSELERGVVEILEEVMEDA